jgi:hypothetical protein
LRNISKKLIDRKVRQFTKNDWKQRKGDKLKHLQARQEVQLAQLAQPHDGAIFKTNMVRYVPHLLNQQNND